MYKPTLNGRLPPIQNPPPQKLTLSGQKALPPIGKTKIYLEPQHQSAYKLLQQYQQANELKNRFMEELDSILTSYYYPRHLTRDEKLTDDQKNACFNLYLSALAQPFKIIGRQDYCTKEAYIPYNFGYNSGGHHQTARELIAERQASYATMKHGKVHGALNPWQKAAMKATGGQAINTPNEMNHGAVLLTRDWSIILNDYFILGSIHAIAQAKINQCNNLGQKVDPEALPAEIHLALPERVCINPMQYLWLESYQGLPERASVTAREIVGILEAGFSLDAQLFYSEHDKATKNLPAVFLSFTLTEPDSIKKVLNMQLSDYCQKVEPILKNKESLEAYLERVFSKIRQQYIDAVSTKM